MYIRTYILVARMQYGKHSNMAFEMIRSNMILAVNVSSEPVSCAMMCYPCLSCLLNHAGRQCKRLRFEVFLWPSMMRSLESHEGCEESIIDPILPAAIYTARRTSCLLKHRFAGIVQHGVSYCTPWLLWKHNYLHDRMWSCTGSSASETVNSTLHNVLLTHLTSFLSSSIWTWNGRKKEACIESQCLLCKRLFSISLIITSHKIWPLLTTVWFHFDLEIPRHSMTGWEGVTMIPCMKKNVTSCPAHHFGNIHSGLAVWSPASVGKR